MSLINAVRVTQKQFQCGCFVMDRPHFESMIASIFFPPILDIKKIMLDPCPSTTFYYAKHSKTIDDYASLF